jgi:hypothetical protein
MPFRKEKIKQVCERFLRERVGVQQPIVAAALGMQGMGYYWRGMGSKNVYVAVTSSRLYIIDTTTMSGVRPIRLQSTEPLDAVRLESVDRVFDLRPMHRWKTVVRYVPPAAEGKALTLHFGDHWKAETERLLLVLGARREGNTFYWM